MNQLISNLVVNVANSNAFPGKPVSVEYLVGIAIERKLMEDCISYWRLAQNASARPNDAVVEEVAVRQDVPDEAADGLVILGTPNFLKI